MLGHVVHGGTTVDRRRAQRVGLAVPIELMQGAVQKGITPAYTGQTVNLSTSGAYAKLKAEGTLVRGEVLRVSISIPWEARRIVPLSRIAGLCRIVRADQEEPHWWVALAFCDHQIIQLGAIVVPT
jgi:hypothetical protein